MQQPPSTQTSRNNFQNKHKTLTLEVNDQINPEFPMSKNSPAHIRDPQSTAFQPPGPQSKRHFYKTKTHHTKRESIIPDDSQGHMVPHIFQAKSNKLGSKGLKSDQPPVAIQDLVTSVAQNPGSPVFSTELQTHLMQNLHSFHIIHYLPEVSPAYLQQKTIFLPKPRTHINCKTLVLDLDETLVHCNQDLINSDIVLPIVFPNGQQVNAGINIRPHARDCLETLSQKYEIIVFTASHHCYADVVLDYLDPMNQFIHHRLYRNHCLNLNGVFIKDLRILGSRELADIVIVDNAVHSFGNQLENGIPIVSWYNDYQDQSLSGLMEYLSRLAEVSDVREMNQTTFGLRQFYEDNKIHIESYNRIFEMNARS